MRLVQSGDHADLVHLLRIFQPLKSTPVRIELVALCHHWRRHLLVIGELIVARPPLLLTAALLVAAARYSRVHVPGEREIEL